MQIASEQYYPGFARHIYLKAYRYNLHLLPKSLLIEAGAQNQYGGRDEECNGGAGTDIKAGSYRINGCRTVTVLFCQKKVDRTYERKRS